MKTPIVTLNWNGAADTIKCIEHLKNQSDQNFHIYLLDNHSNSNDRDLLKSKYKADEKVTCHFFEENLGFGKAHNFIFNKILKENNSKYIALINNDAFANKNWLSELLKCATTFNADFVASKMLLYENPKLIDNCGLQFLNTGEIMPIGANLPVNKFENIAQTIGASAGACLLSTEMIKNIGAFDPYFETGYEDAEFSLRATVFGYKCLFNPQAIVQHKAGASIDKIRNEAYAIQLQKNINYTYFKLMPLPVVLFNLPFIIVKYIGLFLVGLFTFRFKFLKIQFRGLVEFLKDWSSISQQRKELKKHQKISSLKILKHQKFFLSIYFQYFKKYILKGKRTIFER